MSMDAECRRVADPRQEEPIMAETFFEVVAAECAAPNSDGLMPPRDPNDDDVEEEEDDDAEPDDEVEPAVIREPDE